MTLQASYTPIADHALLVAFATEVNDQAHAMIVELDRALAADPPYGMIEAVPALVNILISFDPEQTDHRRLEGHLRALVPTLTPQATAGALRTVQVCYEPPVSPDLEAVSQAVGLDKETMINAHLTGQYTVMMYGFSPGYAYLSGVAEAIQVPRKPAPVRDVPAGSVIIAGAQCLVTTLTMPTGWSIIGRSPTRILTQDAQRPFLFDVRDRVRFERISLSTFERLSREAADV